MIREVMHVGLTVRDMEVAKKFYGDILGLNFQGELFMEKEETDRLFGRKNTQVKVAYYNGSEGMSAPPLELLQFVGEEIEVEEADLHRTSISEICLRVDDIEESYRNLKEKGVVFLSEPQTFDFTQHGFGRSKAVYFKDPDGIILELMQVIEK